ncbi:unnamed protein product, partial [Candidula unifasciata]
MGCSASVSGSSKLWPSRKKCPPAVIEVSPAQPNHLPTPRNWTSLTQNIQHAYRKRKQLEGKKLFLDSEFPPRDASIGSKQFRHGHGKIVWARPHDLSLHPVLIADGTEKNELKQGELNNCWFITTLALIAEKPQLMSKIIPEEASFGSLDYNGAFRCRFWQFGKWVEVRIDDMLPTVDGKLLFSRSSNPNEFWVSLVEKAYAKLYKSYEALEYGFEADAYTDLTGGVAEWYIPSYLKENDFYFIRTAYQCGAIIGCFSGNRRRANKHGRNGINGPTSSHSYVVTAVEEIPYIDRAAKLIRVRNPWGNTQWDGEWCDGGDEWKRVPEVVKKELDVTAQDEGEFWMSYSDFRKEYSCMIICNVSPDFDHDGISDKAEYQVQLRGRWEKGFNSGGCIECNTFHFNPQYHIVIHTDANVQRRYSGRLPLVICLLQVYRRGIPKPKEEDDLYVIGFELFQLPGIPISPLSPDFFQSVDPLMPENEETYAKYRETSGRFFLRPGDYLLVPSTHEPDKTRDYLLRLFSVGKIDC